MNGIVLIGASTGAPRSHHVFLQKWPDNLNMPIVIVQHMPPGPFIEGMYRYLRHFVRDLKWVSHGAQPEPGVLYLIEPGHHVRFSRNGSFNLQEDRRENAFCPSMDITFASAAAVYGKQTYAIMVSGLHANHDGREGCKAIRYKGGKVIVAKPSSVSCPIMIEQVKKANAYDIEVPLVTVLDAVPVAGPLTV